MKLKTGAESEKILHGIRAVVLREEDTGNCKRVAGCSPRKRLELCIQLSRSYGYRFEG